MSRTLAMKYSCFFLKNNYFFYIYINKNLSMAVDDLIHKKMVKVVLWKMAWLDKVPNIKLDDSLIEDINETKRPRIRWIKEFFLLWVNELRRDIKKTKEKYEK